MFVTAVNMSDGTIDVQQGTVQASATNTLGTATNYNVGASGTLDIGGFAQNIQSLTGAGNVTNSGATDATLTVGTNNTSSTTPYIFAGTLTDGATNRLALIVDGTRPMVLTGDSTYTGGTLVCDCATLQIGNGGTTGSIAGDVILGGKLIFNRSDALTFNGNISDSLGGHGTVIQTGGANSVTVLDGTNSYSGGTKITSGTVQVTNSNSVGLGDVILDGGTRFKQGGAGGLTFTNNFKVPHCRRHFCRQ